MEDVARMDGIRVGRSLRALRIRAGKRQADVAGPLGISRQLVSKVETGQIDDVTCGTIERIAAGLGARAEWRINWRGEGLDRLLDGDHAEIVESLARMLRDLGWETAVEVSFNVRGERGSVDLAALDRPTSTVLIAEVKTVVPDAGPMLFTLDRKARLAPEIAKSLGWPCKTVARALVIGESSTTRRRIASLGATFAAALPKRGREVMRWLKTPDGPMAGLLFLPYASNSGTRRRLAGRQRVRVARRRPNCP